MLNRRTLIGAALAGLALAGAAEAQDWKAKYPELTFAIVPAENASGVTDRYGPFVDYLSREIGVPVKLRIANDYAAVIEGQKAGNIHIAFHGPSSYARAVTTGARIEPFVIEVGKGGVKGYYSVFYVKKDSPYQKIEDLKGKNLGLVDPNSTSGNNVPRFALDKMKIDPETFFGKVVYTGSHENAVIALGQGTVDAAANWWNAEDDSNLARMANKGMVKKDDFRIIFKSDMIVNSPYAYLSDLPADLKARIAGAFVDAAKKDKAAFDKLSDGKNDPFERVDHKAYQPIIELNKFVDDLRRKKAS
ncbi:phosphonate ABC transporter substrate-binding protein [Chelatococcus sp. SYSU_G07232]|uniref:Phosphonate ABC transporter substrate-binding protein n=1 Tax=Chelatococcus albus TaxID=3047466 RepID=A0ABT7AI95_9HYPH|nr:phosphonate ABC transporter substrate-binding protein [Chelatococcus sp. SYSU_G07232]MDJ1159111.1 phosphonate ABC transporter substrate-binding protein [Chelatococcus sp. SYSU_G07232]